MEPALASVPFDVQPGRWARKAWNDAKAGLDFLAHNLPRTHQVLVRLNPYPRPWRHVTLEMPDGARLAAWHGPGKPGAGALLMVPGTFQTKDDTSRKRRALDLWRRFGFHTLVVDMRGFGGSYSCVGSAGLQEAEDILEAAGWLARAGGVERVSVWGESFGGATSLLAGARPGAESRLERVVAWAPFADLADAALISSPHHQRGQSRMGRTYRWLLRRRDPRVTDFHEFLKLRAQELGTTVDALLDAGSPARHVKDLRVPGLVFHAEDDPIVPVKHARMLEAAGASRLAVHVLPAGAHLSFDLVAPSWYRSVTDRLFADSPPDA